MKAFRLWRGLCQLIVEHTTASSSHPHAHLHGSFTFAGFFTPTNLRTNHSTHPFSGQLSSSQYLSRQQDFVDYATNRLYREKFENKNDLKFNFKYNKKKTKLKTKNRKIKFIHSKQKFYFCSYNEKRFADLIFEKPMRFIPFSSYSFLITYSF